MTLPPEVRRAIDWGELAPLRLRAREAAEGLFAGIHRSVLRGAGVEFGGFREYVPGDDLRRLDRRSLLRHDRLVVRQFETETDRALCLLLDASASMGFRGPAAPGTKLSFAAVVVAALARVGLANGDPVSLTFVGGADATSVGRTSGGEQFERIVDALERAQPSGDMLGHPASVDTAIQMATRTTKRGAIVILLSDLIDLPEETADRVGSMATGGRIVVVVQVLDPAEVTFPFVGPVRLKGLEGDCVVETDADAARESYLLALGALVRQWRESIVRRGGRFVAATTAEAPVAVVRRIVAAVR
ncbi:MAG: DUF58 domain-containing protein [Polyangiaceae bacterium]|jgi:uncharacterized protein (DUF58 family)